MIPFSMLAMAAGAQLADLVTFLANDEQEANPIVIALGDSASFVKIGLIFSLVLLWVLAMDVEKVSTTYAVKLALVLAVAVGVVGALSNIL